MKPKLTPKTKQAKQKVDVNKRQIPLRIDSKILECLEELSKNEKRSVNGQIEYLLELYLKDKGLLV